METGFIVSVVLNLLAFVLMVVGIVVMLKGIDADEHLAADGLRAVKYFTVQSNWLYGTYALVFAICEIACGSADKIPAGFYTLKYVFTVGVTLTMLTVIFFLAPIVVKSYPELFKGANLYYHLLIPVLGIVSFCFFEKDCTLSVKQTLYGMIPFMLYGVYYSITALSHAENGQVEEKYDWYRFLAHGTSKVIPAIVVMVAAALGVCFGLRFIHSL